MTNKALFTKKIQFTSLFSKHHHVCVFDQWTVRKLKEIEGNQLVRFLVLLVNLKRRKKKQELYRKQ